MKGRKTTILIISGIAVTATATWALRQYVAGWEELEKASGFLVNITLLIGAIAAVVKFQLYNLFAPRWRSDLECKHVELVDGSVIFIAEYVVTNTGERPLLLQCVHMRLVGALTDKVLLKPDEKVVYAKRDMGSDEPSLKGLFHIEAGERSVYTLRCKLTSLEDFVFVVCNIEFSHRRTPAGFTGFYMKEGKQLQTGSSTIQAPSGENES